MQEPVTKGVDLAKEVVIQEPVTKWQYTLPISLFIMALLIVFLVTILPLSR
ncbi:hypothetical protein [uncultured Photobacterium sp.]|uniref:hypothetical protein n=1 Tax=uncultured Photobacterium sp. TaxID=173973 RepID=UPI002606D38F|nr:hypothetical protein [uncultured Photobacterium sp.]